jgi:hypothetical protein
LGIPLFMFLSNVLAAEEWRD